MRLTRMLALGAAGLVLFSACSLGGGSKPTIKIGSVGFYEAKIMAEIYAQQLEANGYTVDRTGIGLGDRSVVAPAIESGQIDGQSSGTASRTWITPGVPSAHRLAPMVHATSPATGGNPGPASPPRPCGKCVPG